MVNFKTAHDQSNKRYKETQGKGMFESHIIHQFKSECVFAVIEILTIKYYAICLCFRINCDIKCQAVLEQWRSICDSVFGKKRRFYSVCANARRHKIGGRNLKQFNMAWTKQVKIKLIRSGCIRRFKTAKKEKGHFKALFVRLPELYMTSTMRTRVKSDLNDGRSDSAKQTLYYIVISQEHNKIADALAAKLENESYDHLQSGTHSHYTSQNIEMNDVRWGRCRQYRVVVSMA